jgi:hypothetical protein
VTLSTSTDNLGDLMDRAAIRDDRRRRREPWNGDALARLVLWNGAGLVLVVLGWYEASGRGRPGPGISWLNVSILGLLVSGAANGMWLLRQRRTVTMARVSILPVLHRDAALSEGPLKMPAHDEESVTRVWIPGLTRYHRQGCPLIAGKEVSPTQGLEPLAACEMCEP